MFKHTNLFHTYFNTYFNFHEIWRTLLNDLVWPALSLYNSRAFICGKQTVALWSLNLQILYIQNIATLTAKTQHFHEKFCENQDDRQVRTLDTRLEAALDTWCLPDTLFDMNCKHWPKYALTQHITSLSGRIKPKRYIFNCCWSSIFLDSVRNLFTTCLSTVLNHGVCFVNMTSALLHLLTNTRSLKKPEEFWLRCSHAPLTRKIRLKSGLC